MSRRRQDDRVDPVLLAGLICIGVGQTILTLSSIVRLST